MVEQGGTIRIIKNKKVLAKPFLNITSLVVSGGEEGLLGLAFHPAYKTNGRFFVNYTRMVLGHRFKPSSRSITSQPPTVMWPILPDEFCLQ